MANPSNPTPGTHVPNPAVFGPTNVNVPTYARALWVLAPIVSLGLLAWAPFVYGACRRHRVVAHNWWIAFGAATVVEVVLAAVTDATDNEALKVVVGFYCVVLIVVSAILTWIKLGPKTL